MRETDTRTNETEVSAKPLDASAVAVLKGACTVRWFSNRAETYIPAGPAHADAVVLSTTTTRSCALPPNCQPDQFCALGLRNAGAGAGTIVIDGKFDWPNASGLGNQPQRESDLELGLITSLAGVQLFPPPDSDDLTIDPSANWTCVIPAVDNVNCRLALEHKPDGSFPAFVSQDGTIVAIEDGALSSWAAMQPPSARSELFGKQIDGAIAVYGSGNNAWLVGDPEGARLEVIRSNDGTKVPISGAVKSDYGSPAIWRKRKGNDLVLDATADLIAGVARENLAVTDLGEVEGGHRVLVSSNDQFWLLSSGDTGVCIRQQKLDEIIKKDSWARSEGATPIRKLANALTMSTDKWRKAGFLINPAIALFGNSCI